MSRVFEACPGGNRRCRLSEVEPESGGGLVKGWQGQVEGEEDRWKRNGVIAKA